MTRTLPGIGIGRARVVGPVVRMPDAAGPATARVAGTPDSERTRATTALAAVAIELNRRAELANPVGAAIIEAQALMASDPGVLELVEEATASGATAERAIESAYGRYRELLAAGGEYLAGRVADVDDVARRALAACSGSEGATLPTPGHPYVLVARDLAPADTALLDLDEVLALVTEEGGPTSHTAILARARGIPAIVGCPTARVLEDGATVLVDASANQVVLDPTAHELPPPPAPSAATRRRTDEPGHTRDGVPIALLANIGGAADVEVAHHYGAEGVGLLRTEFLFMHRSTAPTVEEQVAAYRSVLDGFPGKRVVARVLDAGADKPMAFLAQAAEANPALGIRGLRALRAHLNVLDDQLDALGTAASATNADLWVMAPMIADVDEARWFAGRCAEHGIAPVGAMIEIPSAALTAPAVLGAVDFVSIGTNDLAQYALAADRMLGSLGHLLDPWHPAVLHLAALVGQSATSAGKPAGVCGEAAADPLLACAFVGIGITSLSMTPAAIPDVKDALAEHTMDECRAIANRILDVGTVTAARAAVTGAAPHLRWLSRAGAATSQATNERSREVIGVPRHTGSTG
jgi:phosphotransferase system enzyme I (PtsI)